MIRGASKVLLMLTIIAVCATPSFAWKFASMADSRGSTDGVNVAELTKIINLVNLENVDLVIFQGDSVDGSTSDSILESQMDNWVSVMNTLNCPWYYTVGNHEIRTATSEDVIRSKVSMPINGPSGYAETVFSFDHENAHFVALNSNHYGEVHRVQRSWLATDLAATTKPHKFVMAHEPAYPKGPHIGSSLDVYPTERDDFWSIMTMAGVRMYFTGHEHFYARSLHGSVLQVINGTCGAPIYTGTPGTIAKYHYVVADVNGYTVSCQAKDDTGAVFDSWSYTVTVPVARIADLKGLPDSTPIALPAKTVTAGTDQLSYTCYIEEEDRSSGIKIFGSTFTALQGSGITVTGLMGTSSGERIINNPSITTTGAPYPIPQPLAMQTQYVCGGVLNSLTPGVTGNVHINSTGLVVQVQGIVTYVNTVGKYFYVDDGCRLNDGSGQTGLMVHCGGRPTGSDIILPEQNSIVTAAGIASCRTLAGKIVPALRVRSQSDIVEYAR